VSIGTRFGVVEVTLAGGHLVDGELTFIDNQSVEWTDDLGVGYILNFSYNNQLSRWELSYFSNELNQDIVIGVLYGDDTCPVSNCNWDLECISSTANYKEFNTIFTWNGAYLNGKKSYSWTETSLIPNVNFVVSWGLAPIEALAPAGTECWTLYYDNGEPIPVYPLAFLFTNTQCAFGNYVASWTNPVNLITLPDLGVTGFDLKTSIIECGCCDTTLQLEIGVEGLGVITADASVEYDAYGNILGINGKPYYVFEVDSSSDGCDCISVTYTLQGEEPVTVEVDVYGVEFGKNYYEFLIDGNPASIDWNHGHPDSWALNYGDFPPYLPLDTPCPFGTYTIVEGSFFEAFSVSECEPEMTTYYLFFLDGEWVVKTTLGDGPIIVPPSAVLESNSDCPFGFYSTNLDFYSFWVRGVECFDCCNYYAPRFSNFIKKKKYDLVSDISSIRNKEIFGMKCGPEWSELFRKHLILDVLSCLPYGVLCEEDEQCLIKNVNENCNC
jgi:hypothetical protein